MLILIERMFAGGFSGATTCDSRRCSTFGNLRAARSSNLRHRMCHKGSFRSYPAPASDGE